MKLVQTITVASVAALMISMSGCSQDEENTDNGAIAVFTLPEKKIETIEDAKNAAAVVSSDMGSVQPSSARTAPILESVQRVAVQKATQTVACDSGEMVITTDDNNPDNGTAEYKNCNIDGTIMNGTMTFTDTEYNVKLTMTNAAQDYSYSGEYILTMSQDGVFQVMDIFGNISLSVSGNTFKGGYEHLKIADSSDAFKIDGKLSIQTSQTPCTDGSYTYQTVQALSPSNYGNIGSGEVKVNGVSYKFYETDARQGKITVTFADGRTDTINQGVPPVCN